MVHSYSTWHCSGQTLCALLQALKPEWPADDCYHGCCNGETAPVSSVDIGAKASAAKETAKEAIKTAEEVAGKVCCPYHFLSR